MAKSGDNERRRRPASPPVDEAADALTYAFDNLSLEPTEFANGMIRDDPIAPEPTKPPTLLSLDDDCLYAIFTWINLAEVLSTLSTVCSRFNSVATKICHDTTSLALIFSDDDRHHATLDLFLHQDPLYRCPQTNWLTVDHPSHLNFAKLVTIFPNVTELQSRIFRTLSSLLLKLPWHSQLVSLKIFSQNRHDNTTLLELVNTLPRLRRLAISTIDSPLALSLIARLDYFQYDIYLASVCTREMFHHLHRHTPLIGINANRIQWNINYRPLNGLALQRAVTMLGRTTFASLVIHIVDSLEMIEVYAATFNILEHLILRKISFGRSYYRFIRYLGQFPRLVKLQIEMLPNDRLPATTPMPSVQLTTVRTLRLAIPIRIGWQHALSLLHIASIFPEVREISVYFRPDNAYLAMIPTRMTAEAIRQSIAMYLAPLRACEHLQVITTFIQTPYGRLNYLAGKRIWSPEQLFKK